MSEIVQVGADGKPKQQGISFRWEINPCPVHGPQCALVSTDIAGMSQRYDHMPAQHLSGMRDVITEAMLVFERLKTAEGVASLKAVAKPV